MRGIGRVLGLGAAVLFATLLVWVQFRHWQGVIPADDAFRFRLVDQQGRETTEADFAGRILLVYFGYTYCPDVCPTTLGMVAEAMRRLGPEGGHVVPLMITIDPERDTPEVLADYMAAFGPAFVGLSGPSDAVAQAARRMGVVYFKAGTGADYTMDHSADLYIIGADGRRRGTLPHGVQAVAVVEAVRRLVPTLSLDGGRPRK